MPSGAKKYNRTRLNINTAKIQLFKTVITKAEVRLQRVK